MKYKLGKKDEAIRNLNKILALDSNHKDAINMLKSWKDGISV
jgi:hypothetical protein